jgi:hypothetical protein
MSNLFKPKKYTSSMKNSDDSEIADHPGLRRMMQSIERDRSQRNDSLAQRFFPTKKTRLIREGEAQLVRVDFDYQIQQLQVVHETQLQELKEKCNEYLIRGKIKIRAETTAFALAEQQRLQDELDRIFNEFKEAFRKKHEALDREQNPVIQGMMEADMEESYENFVHLRQDLLKKFNNIVNEGV